MAGRKYLGEQELNESALTNTVGEMENGRVDVWVKNNRNETKEFFKAFGDCIGWYEVETSDLR